jgi:hypothetical protein
MASKAAKVSQPEGTAEIIPDDDLVAVVNAKNDAGDARA